MSIEDDIIKADQFTKKTAIPQEKLPNLINLV